MAEIEARNLGAVFIVILGWAKPRGQAATASMTALASLSDRRTTAGAGLPSRLKGTILRGSAGSVGSPPLESGVVVVRAAELADAADISAVIVDTIRISNATDYPRDVIERVSENFSAPSIVRMITDRHVLVASVADRIVATASLDGAEVRSVFVQPEHQVRGIGARLVAEILNSARERRRTAVKVQSTLTAVGFYKRLGFVAVRDHWHDNERTVIMECPL